MDKLAFLQILFVYLLILFLSVIITSACGLPTSPELPISSDSEVTAYSYGLYDDFESGYINTKLWSFVGPSKSKYINVIDDGTRNHVLEIMADVLDSLHLDRPTFLYPDEFDKMSAKIKLFSSETADAYGANINYKVSIPEQGGLNWITKIGIRKDSVRSPFLYAEWKNWNTGKGFLKNLGDAEFEKWYKLEIRIKKLDDTTLKVEYWINDRVLAESIPEDSPILLDHNRVGYMRYSRSLQAGTLSSVWLFFAKAWFDDVWAVHGENSPDFGRIKSNSKSPIITEELRGSIRHYRINSDKGFLDKKEQAKRK